jgi:hypothetical protein
VHPRQLDVQSEEGELFSKIQILRVRATFAGGAMDMAQQRRRWTDEEVTKLMSMAQIPVSPNRCRNWPKNEFRPREGPRTGYLLANGSAPTTDTAHGASGLDLTGSSTGTTSPLDPVVHAGSDCAFPRAKMRRALYGAIAGENVPTPNARLNLLDVVINGAMLHDGSLA